MTSNERVDLALIRVKGGETITGIIRGLYHNARQYRQKTSTYQRAEISRARQEYLSTRPDPGRIKYPRLFVETRPERRKTVEDHCRFLGISIRRFVNSAIAEALKKAKSVEGPA